MKLKNLAFPSGEGVNEVDGRGGVRRRGEVSTKLTEEVTPQGKARKIAAFYVITARNNKTLRPPKLD